MRRRNEYEVIIEPDGTWNVRHVHDERVRTVAGGREKGPDCMELAEIAARRWVEGQLHQLESQVEYRKRCKVFSMPATVPG